MSKIPNENLPSYSEAMFSNPPVDQVPVKSGMVHEQMSAVPTAPYTPHQYQAEPSYQYQTAPPHQYQPPHHYQPAPSYQNQTAPPQQYQPVPPQQYQPAPPHQYQPPHHYQPAPSYQYQSAPTIIMPPATNATTVINNNTMPQVVLMGGGCPTCRVGVLEEQFTVLGLLCAIVFFPVGILCCLSMTQKKCTNCGTTF